MLEFSAWICSCWCKQKMFRYIRWGSKNNTSHWQQTFITTTPRTAKNLVKLILTSAAKQNAGTAASYTSRSLGYTQVQTENSQDRVNLHPDAWPNSVEFFLSWSPVFGAAPLRTKRMQTESCPCRGSGMSEGPGSSSAFFRTKHYVWKPFWWGSCSQDEKKLYYIRCRPQTSPYLVHLSCWTQFIIKVYDEEMWHLI